MLYQRIGKFWNNIFQNKRKMIFLPLVLLLVCTGCEQDTGEEKTEQGKKEQQISVEQIVIGESTEEKKQEISQDYSTLRNELAQLLHITISCVEVKQKSR